jgi:hypothetical protein
MLSQILINLSLLAFAMAEETLKTTGHGDAWKYGSGGGVIGFIVLILDILVFSTLPLTSNTFFGRTPTNNSC